MFLTLHLGKRVLLCSNFEKKPLKNAKQTLKILQKWPKNLEKTLNLVSKIEWPPWKKWDLGENFVVMMSFYLVLWSWD